MHGYSENLGTEEALVALCGVKGAGLTRMRQLGLPVPEGFMVTMEVCAGYLRSGKLPEGLMGQLMDHLARLEEATGRGFGGPENPLLVSVRSETPVSMPGMMDTVLNLCLNDSTVHGLAKSTGNERFAQDSHRCFIQAFGEIVLKAPGPLFKEAIENFKGERDVEADTELSAQDLEELVRWFKDIVAREARAEFPEDPNKQLELAIGAIFDSWLGERAVAYRKDYGIPESLATAATVQRMAFCNIGETSATGVAFTRDPATGEQGIFGETLLNAQGEDVFAGIRTPRPLRELVLPPSRSQHADRGDRARLDIVIK